MARGGKKVLKLIHSHLPLPSLGHFLPGFSRHPFLPSPPLTIPGFCLEKLGGRRARGGGHACLLSHIREACPLPILASTSPAHQPGCRYSSLHQFADGKMKASRTACYMTKVIQPSLEEQDLGPRPQGTCCLPQRRGPLPWAVRLQFSAIQGQGFGREHPGGCQQEGMAACTSFCHSSSLEQGGVTGINKACRMVSCPLPGSPRQALLPLTCPSLETGKPLFPQEKAPPGFSSSGVCTISSLVQTCSIPGPIKKPDSGQVGIQHIAVTSPGL